MRRDHRATLRVAPCRPLMEQRHYLFPDFAGGLAALHEAERQGIALTGACLSDAAQTRFNVADGGRTPEPVAKAGRHLPPGAASGRSCRRPGHHFLRQATRRKRFDALAVKLGAMVARRPGRCRPQRSRCWIAASRWTRSRHSPPGRGCRCSMPRCAPRWTRRCAQHRPAPGAHGLVLAPCQQAFAPMAPTCA